MINFFYEYKNLKNKFSLGQIFKTYCIKSLTMKMYIYASSYNLFFKKKFHINKIFHYIILKLILSLLSHKINGNLNNKLNQIKLFDFIENL